MLLGRMRYSFYDIAPLPEAMLVITGSNAKIRWLAVVVSDQDGGHVVARVAEAEILQ